jgi:hypothetical protein
LSLHPGRECEDAKPLPALVATALNRCVVLRAIPTLNLRQSRMGKYPIAPARRFG